MNRPPPANKHGLTTEDYKSFFESLGKEVICSATNAKGDIIYANDKFVEVSQYSREELLGQNHRIIKSGFHPPEFYKVLWTTISSGRVWRGEIKNKAKDGTYYWVDTSIAPILGANGKPLKYVSVRFLITEKKQAEEALRQSVEQLETANKELESFSYSISHDLRTPLRAISGFIQLVMDKYKTKLDLEGVRYLSLIQKSAHKMWQLIDDLLTFSRLGREKMEEKKIDMERLVQEVVEELKILTPERKMQFIIQHPLPSSYGDQSMIRQVFVNLLSNAIKFTKTRELAVIEVYYRQEKDQVIYSIKDNGVGFDMRHIKKLFNIFQRLHSIEEFEGTGVGLALVNRVIIRHGGRVWAEGAVNQGATFSFALPGNFH